MTERDTESGPTHIAGPNSLQVIEKIANHLESDPTKLDFTLADYIDPDALDGLLESKTENLVIAFTIEDLLVTVANDGTILVREYQGD